MKKLVTAAMALAAVSAFAVESANIVGVTERQIQAGVFSMLGVNFEAVGATGDNAEGIYIGDLIDGTFAPVAIADYADIGDGDGWMADAPSIQVRKGGVYEFYYYVSDGWFDDDGDDGAKQGWADGYGCIAGETEYDGMLVSGESIWFKNSANCTVKAKGEVVRTASSTARTTNDEFTMWGNAYPTDLFINDTAKVSFTGLTPVAIADYDDDGWMDAAQMIQIRKGGNYDLYYYVSDAWFDDDGDDGAKPGWADGYGCYAGETEYDGIVETGNGFWIKSATPVTVEFSL